MVSFDSKKAQTRIRENFYLEGIGEIAGCNSYILRCRACFGTDMLHRHPLVGDLAQKITDGIGETGLLFTYFLT